MNVNKIRYKHTTCLQNNNLINVLVTIYVPLKKGNLIRNDIINEKKVKFFSFCGVFLKCAVISCISY